MFLSRVVSSATTLAFDHLRQGVFNTPQLAGMAVTLTTSFHGQADTDDYVTSAQLARNEAVSSCLASAALKRRKQPTRVTGLIHLVTAGLFLALATAASAGDDKTYVGAECRPIDPANSQILLRPNDGGMVNASQADAKQDHQTWICPVVRDQVDKDPEFARITVFENGTDKVTCTFESRDPGGLTPASASPDTRKETLINTNPVQLRVDYIYGSGESTVLSNVPFHGYYYFKCDVPDIKIIQDRLSALSGVLTYIATEQD